MKSYFSKKNVWADAHASIQIVEQNFHAAVAIASGVILIQLYAGVVAQAVQLVFDSFNNNRHPMRQMALPVPCLQLVNGRIIVLDVLLVVSNTVCFQPFVFLLAGDALRIADKLHGVVSSFDKATGKSLYFLQFRIPVSQNTFVKQSLERIHSA